MADLYRGYNSKVRNAISHAGSHGVTIEGQSVLFRDIKRGNAPFVSPVRWTVHELSWNGILIAELLDCLDAATEIFGLDCMSTDNADFGTFSHVADAAFTSSQRAELRVLCRRDFAKVWDDQKISDKQRREMLAEFLSRNYDLHGMELRGLDLSAGERVVLIAVPVEGAIDRAVSGVHERLLRRVHVVHYTV
jgi:hypothetical protein